MSEDAWKKLSNTKEEEYFREQNKLAIQRLQARDSAKARISPVSGSPMEQTTILGVVVDRCPVTGGIWLDAGELEQLLQQASHESSSPGLLEKVFSSLLGR